METRRSRRRRRRRRIDDEESRRISQLPKDILQHILSFLPQRDAIQTCVLSKSWRHLAYTRPNVDLRTSSGDDKDKELFMSALEKTLQTYQEQKQTIRDLRVKMWALDSKSSSIIGELVKNMNVITLRLALTNRDQQHSPLPRLIFQAESLTEIKLTRLGLTNRIAEKVLFKHLKTLHLKYCYIEDEIFANIISSCPLIEYLVLDSCEGLNTIELNEARSLRRFDFTSYFDDISFLNNHFPHLKSLYLDVRFSAKSFDKLFSKLNFPCLEELELDFCRGFKEFVLSSRSIKRLIINNMSCKGTIDAPNILYFKVVSNICRLVPSISLTTTSKEWKSKIVHNCNCSSSAAAVSTCLHKINELLKALSQSHISFKPSSFNDCGHFMGEPAVVEHLDLRGCQHYSFPHYQDILICFFRICRPRYIVGMFFGVTLETETRGSGELTSCKSMIIMKDRVITSGSLCFWQQDLEEISTQVWDGKAKEWHHVQLGSLSRSSTLHALSDKNQIRYRLKWRGEEMSPS